MSKMDKAAKAIRAVAEDRDHHDGTITTRRNLEALGDMIDEFRMEMDNEEAFDEEE